MTLEQAALRLARQIMATETTFSPKMREALDVVLKSCG